MAFVNESNGEIKLHMEEKCLNYTHTLILRVDMKEDKDINSSISAKLFLMIMNRNIGLDVTSVALKQEHSGDLYVQNRAVPNFDCCFVSAVL